MWPPEFFADRCLGKGAPRLLVQRGWTVHVLADRFADDAQMISDPEWAEHGFRQGWTLLTQDERMAHQPAVHRLIRTYGGLIHCLDSADLIAEAKAAWFHSRQRAIYQHVRDRRVGFFIVPEHGRIRRKR